MSIQKIDDDHSKGFQVRVFRAKKVMTAFFAFKKYGGVESALEIARQKEQELEKAAGPKIKARRYGDNADKPNRNSSTKVVGIQAFYLQTNNNPPVLQFVASWSIGAGKKKARVQFSAKTYGRLNALGKALAARAEGTGIKSLTARQAWEIIKTTKIPVRKRNR